MSRRQAKRQSFAHRVRLARIGYVEMFGLAALARAYCRSPRNDGCLVRSWRPDRPGMMFWKFGE